MNCKLCARNCKASCIDVANHSIDYSRCVSCMDCIEKCSTGAIGYRHVANVEKHPKAAAEVDANRRNFLTATAMVATTAVLNAQGKKVDGGLAVIEDKKRLGARRPLCRPGRGAHGILPNIALLANFVCRFARTACFALLPIL